MAVYQYAVNVELMVTIPSTLSLVGATVLGQLVKPTGTRIEVEPSVMGTVVSYYTQPNDLTEVGEYSLRIRIVYEDSIQVIYADPFFFRVWPNDREGN